VPGANVTITDDLTKVAIKTQTNGSGVFVAPDLNVSTYTVTIAKAGFKNYTVTGVELHPTETVAVNGVLSVRCCLSDRVRRGSLHSSGNLHS